MANGIDTQDLDLDQYLAQLEIDLQQQVDNQELTEEEKANQIAEARLNYSPPPKTDYPTQLKINGHFYNTEEIVDKINNPEKGSDWENLDNLDHYLKLLQIQGHKIEDADGIPFISPNIEDVPDIEITEEAKLQYEDMEIPSETPYAENMEIVGKEIKNTFKNTPIKTYDDLAPLNEKLNAITPPPILLPKYEEGPFIHLIKNL